MSPVSTPCIKVCVIDQPSRLCRGCWRSLDEIAAWSVMSEADRLNVMAGLEARRGRLAGTAS